MLRTVAHIGKSSGLINQRAWVQLPPVLLFTKATAERCYL